jgi:hypothetical protein
MTDFRRSIQEIKRAYTPDVDAFGRDRVSEPFGIYDNKNIMSKNDNQWEELTSGGSSTITWLSDEAAVQLQAGTGATDYAIRQTHRYLAYVPGKSQNITATFVLGAAKANVVQRVGYYDDNNGLFLEQDEDGIYFVVRTSTSGSPVDTRVHQNNPSLSTDGISVWNKDKLDGTGRSGIDIDLTKSQILHIDFQWLGVGTVRFCFDVGGQIISAHHVDNANSLDKVYMATPTLPMRYEIRNTAISASATTMKEICCSVSSEGGYSLPGLEFTKGRGVTSKAVTTRAPIFAIRLKNTFNSKDNRRIGRFLHANFFVETNNAYFEIAHVHNPTGITATWTDVSSGSAVEYSTDISVITGNPEHIVGDTYVASGQGGKGGINEEDATFINLHSYFSQNNDSTNSQMYLIYATSVSGTADAYCSIKWLEFE